MGCWVQLRRKSREMYKPRVWVDNTQYSTARQLAGAVIKLRKRGQKAGNISHVTAEHISHVTAGHIVHLTAGHIVHVTAGHISHVTTGHNSYVTSGHTFHVTAGHSSHVTDIIHVTAGSIEEESHRSKAKAKVVTAG